MLTGSRFALISLNLRSESTLIKEQPRFIAQLTLTHT